MINPSLEQSQLQPDQVATNTVVLWTAPRCVSTAFQKTFAQRSDTIVCDEPFLDTYYFSPWRYSRRFGEAEATKEFVPPENIIQSILGQRSPLVFMKDMAYQAGPYVDEMFLRAITNTFIVREPREAIASWYRVNEHPTEEEFGFVALHKIWTMVTQQLNQTPIVVEANKFRRNPTQILMAYCQAIGASFDPQMLSWKQEEQPRQWEPHELESRAKWYKTLDKSSGILPPTPVEVDIRAADQDMVAQATTIYEEISQFAL